MIKCSTSPDWSVTITRRERVLEQLETAATLAQVTGLLKSRKLAYSAVNWKEMKEKRLLPALKEGAISEGDLISIIREAEEYGNQHVLLYQTGKAYTSAIVNDDTLRQSLKELGREDLLTSPVIVGEPPSIMLTDARIDLRSGHRALVLKAIETVTYLRPIGTSEEEHGRFLIKRFERIKERAANVLVVHDDGLVEMRLFAYDSATTYQEKAEEVWRFFAPFVDRFKAEDMSVTRAQNAFWRRRDEFKGIIKYGDSRIRDLSGNTASFASGGESQNLFDAPNARAGFDAFYGDEGMCDRSNFWFIPVKKEGGDLPSREVHIRFSGAINEFVIPVSCSREDYEYALGQIRSFNS